MLDAVQAVRVPLTTERQSTQTKDASTLPAPRPISVKQIEANQRNALHSTGPTTPEGKLASRLNALKHGLRAKEVIIPGQEDPAELEAILRGLCEDWEPEGYTQLLLVEQIALAQWRLRRGIRAELGQIRKQMSDSEAGIYRKPEGTELEIARQRLSIPQGFDREQIQRYETPIKRDMYKAIDQLEHLQSRRRGEPPPPTVNVNVSKDD